MIKVENLEHTYFNGVSKYEAIKNINFHIPKNSFSVVLGQSGSGKTTLLNIISGLLKPTNGNIYFFGENVYSKTDSQLSDFRKCNVGFVFQNYFLDNNFTAIENVSIPLFLNKNLSKKDIYQKAKEALSNVGLQEKINNKPTQLSGGECQRVAIARAIVSNPKVIIADEPTGNLDSKNGELIIELLRKQVENGKSVIMVTHNNTYIKDCDFVFRISDGQIGDAYA